MKRALFSFIFVVAFVALLLQTGCNREDRNPSADEAISKPVLESGTANVNFKLVLPQNGDEKPLADIPEETSHPGVFRVSTPSMGDILPALSDVKVTFKLIVVNAGNTQTPTATVQKLVGVDANGMAEATFTGIPTLTAIGKIHIDGGNVGGVTDYRGAADLVAGDNTITLVAQGLKTKPDVVAQVIENLIANPTKFAGVPKKLATQVGYIVDLLDLSSPSIYNDATNNYFNVEFTPPTGYSTIGYPALGGILPVTGLTSGTKMAVVLTNRGDSSVNISLSATLGAAPNIITVKPQASIDNKPISLTAEQKAHLYLRESEKSLPHGFTASSVTKAAKNIRAEVEGDVVTFKVTTQLSSASQVTATLRKRSQITGYSNYVNFYLDNNDSYTSTVQTLINSLAASWSSIYAKDRQIFGNEPSLGYRSLTSDDITILITSKITDAIGFFWSGDLYPASQIAGGVSNNRKMFYLKLDSSYTVSDLSSTMAHEFQHMINFYQKDLNSLSEDDWLNEGMSGYAEYVNGYTFSNGNQSKTLQAKEFLGNVNTTGLTTWTGSHANYGEVYLFSVWLGQNFATDSVVSGLLSSKSTGKANVVSFTGQTFEKTLGQWLLALYVNDTTGGKYGYPDINLRTTYTFGAGLADVTLTGPTVKANSGVFSYSTGNISLAPWASAYIELTGTSGNVTNLSLPTTVSCFELLK